MPENTEQPILNTPRRKARTKNTIKRTPPTSTAPSTPRKRRSTAQTSQPKATYHPAPNAVIKTPISAKTRADQLPFVQQALRDIESAWPNGEWCPSHRLPPDGVGKTYVSTLRAMMTRWMNSGRRLERLWEPDGIFDTAMKGKKQTVVSQTVVIAASAAVDEVIRRFGKVEVDDNDGQGNDNNDTQGNVIPDGEQVVPVGEEVIPQPLELIDQDANPYDGGLIFDLNFGLPDLPIDPALQAIGALELLDFDSMPEENIFANPVPSTDGVGIDPRKLDARLEAVEETFQPNTAPGSQGGKVKPGEEPRKRALSPSPPPERPAKQPNLGVTSSSAKPSAEMTLKAPRKPAMNLTRSIDVDTLAPPPTVPKLDPNKTITILKSQKKLSSDDIFTCQSLLPLPSDTLVFDPGYPCLPAPACRREIPRYVVLTLNQNMHWTLMVIDRKAKKVDHYNSLVAFEINVHHLAKWLFESGICTWNDMEYKEQPCPQQTDGRNCGVFALVFFAHVVAAQPPPRRVDPSFWREFFAGQIERGTKMGREELRAVIRRLQARTESALVTSAALGLEKLRVQRPVMRLRKPVVQRPVGDKPMGLVAASGERGGSRDKAGNKAQVKVDIGENGPERKKDTTGKPPVTHDKDTVQKPEPQEEVIKPELPAPPEPFPPRPSAPGTTSTNLITSATAHLNNFLTARTQLATRTTSLTSALVTKDTTLTAQILKLAANEVEIQDAEVEVRGLRAKLEVSEQRLEKLKVDGGVLREVIARTNEERDVLIREVEEIRRWNGECDARMGHVEQGEK